MSSVSTVTNTDHDPILEGLQEDVIEVADQGPEAVEQTLATWCERYPDREDAFRNEARAIFLLWGLREPERLGQYRLLDVLTTGGMGKIYRAKEDVTGRIVVVKTVLAGHLSPAKQVKRFDTERRLLSRLHDTHIVPLLATGREGYLLYMVMPFIPGVTLQSVIATVAGRDPGAKPFPTFESLFAAASKVESKKRMDPTAHPVEPDSGDSSGPSQPTGRSAIARDRRSAGYFCDVAMMMEHVAGAVQHIHKAKILHRDLKPSNIMIESTGHSWVIDIGLGRELDQDEDTVPGTVPGPTPLADGMTGGIGTLAYMAPEQLGPLAETADPSHPARHDARTDVWGLGATLYELLSLRLPFPGQSKAEVARKIMSEPPERLNGPIPRELRAICLKALEKEPDNRYPTAADLAGDLRRWLDVRPTVAGEAAIRRKAGRLPGGSWVRVRRLGFWSRRRPAAAFAAGLLTALLLFGILGAKAQLDAAQRELDIHALQQLRTPIRKMGWFPMSWERVRSLRGGSRSPDPRLQALAAAGLGDLDARTRKTFDHEATMLVFEAKSQRLLMIYQNPYTENTRTRLWDGATDQVLADVDLGFGVAAFRADRRPVQLGINPKDPALLDMHDVSSGKVIQQFRSPRKGHSECRSISITPTATHLAAVIWPASQEKVGAKATEEREEEQSTIAVWDAATGKLVRSWEHKAGLNLDLLLSPDARLLATWEPTKPVHVWKVDDGQEVGTYRMGRAYVTSVAFGHDPVWREGPQAALPPWLLAVGDSGGLITIWDLRAGAVRSLCRGSTHNVTSLDFSPDGSLLLSAGRNPAKLWDVATGTCVLDLPIPNAQVQRAASFSPDGRRIAVGWGPEFTPKEGVAVLELEYGRGLLPLFGLEGVIDKVLFSPDGRYVAASGHNWEVGIWEVPVGRLRGLLPAPVGRSVDSTGLAFDTRNNRFACAAGRQVRLWDLKTERLLEEWTIPDGLCNALAFAASGSRLLLMRLETRDKRLPPVGGAHPREHPRVCRLYDLRVKEPAKPIQEITEFDWHVFEIAVNADGTCFVIDGTTTASGRPERMLQVYEGSPVKLVGPLPLKLPLDSGASPFFDPTGKFLVVYSTEAGNLDLISVPGLQPRGRLPRDLFGLGPGGQGWLERNSSPTGALLGPLVLHEKGSNTPWLRVAQEATAPSGNAYRFSPDGRWIVWGHVDGRVTVCDLVEVNRSLSELYLGW